MTPLRQQMMAALELNGKSPATVEAEGIKRTV